MMIFAALGVVTTNNVVHAALWLVMVLGGVAAQYILAAAEFVAVSQVLVYIGAVMVLFLFGIMLTRAQIGVERNSNNKGWGSASRSPCCCSGCSRGSSSTPTKTRHRRAAAAVRDRGRSATAFSTVPRAVHRRLLRPARRRHRRHRPGAEGLTMLAANFLLLAAVLFCIGVFGVIARRNAVMVLMSIELILNAVNLNLIAFALMNNNHRRPRLRPVRDRDRRRRGRRRAGDGADDLPQPQVDRARRTVGDEGLMLAAERTLTRAGSSRTPG